MAKIVVSKGSGKRYLVLEAAELSQAETNALAALNNANRIAAEASKVLRELVLQRQELQGYGLNQVYPSYGGSVKIGKGSEANTPKVKSVPKSLSDMLDEFNQDGIAH